ncbi:unnamed protein product [Euphydryas editha]|uniref:Enoyl-CoA hydratase domain-containing protein 3, mitochondrial n=1 Tax=Euphydryas editha TaxID=104508 RepID=A0AAU9U4J5_EUPED|nr:unnamed protein product [Euphydryas editha]
MLASKTSPEVVDLEWSNLRKPHRPPKFSVFSPEDGRLSIHPSSVMAGLRGENPCKNPGANWIVYWLKQRTTELFLLDVTFIYTLPLLFFGEFAVSDDVENPLDCFLSISNIKVRCKRDSADVFMELRSLLDKVLASKIQDSSTHSLYNNEFEEQVLKNILKPFNITKRGVHNQYLIIKESNGTREITLNHEKTKNSLSLPMMKNLIEAINVNKNDTTIRAIVLSANGNVFSAGHNLKELQMSAGTEHHKLIFNKATELMKSVILSPVPVIAKVDGFATAAGCQLVATCDIIICSDKSKFSTPGANFGIFCSTPGIAVGRSVPKSRAMHMLLTGEPITAQEAYDSGLVTKVVSADKLDEEVNKIIEQIKLKSRSVIALGKEFFYKQINLNIHDAYKLGEEIMVQNVNSNDGQEGILSFVEKRKACWSHN